MTSQVLFFSTRVEHTSSKMLEEPLDLIISTKYMNIPNIAVLPLGPRPLPLPYMLKVG